MVALGVRMRILSVSRPVQVNRDAVGCVHVCLLLFTVLLQLWLPCCGQCCQHPVEGREARGLPLAASWASGLLLADSLQLKEFLTVSHAQACFSISFLFLRKLSEDGRRFGSGLNVFKASGVVFIMCVVSPQSLLTLFSLVACLVSDCFIYQLFFLKSVGAGLLFCRLSTWVSRHHIPSLLSWLWC